MLAKMLQDEGTSPVEMPRAPMARINPLIAAISKIAPAVLGAYQQQKVTDALKQQDQFKQDKINSLTDALTGNTQLQSVDGSAPETVAQHVQMPGDQPFINRDRLTTALSGMGKDDQTSALSDLMLKRALPQKQEPYTLAEGAMRMGPDNKPLAWNPKDVKPNEADRQLINIVDEKQKSGYRTIKRSDWQDGMQLYEKPTAAQSAEANANKPLDEGTIGMLATGIPLATTVPGYGREASLRRDAYRVATIQKIQKDNPGMTAYQAGEELSRRNIDWAASKSSGTQLEKMKGATDQAIGQLDFNVDKATEELNKLSSSDLSPVLNAIARGADKWTGDKHYASAFFYLHGAAMESARLQSGGQASIAQLNQGAADKAQEWANMGLTPSMWGEVGTAMKAEGRARYATFQDAYQRQTGRAPNTQPGTPLTAPGGQSEGAKSISKSGKPITFKNGQWVYD